MSRVSKRKSVTPEDLPFETALSELETIVKALEDGELALEEALNRFSEGMTLSRVCLDRLNAAETRIDQILTEEKGKYVQKPLELEME
ncbi:MAG TPA: exodeoxyribonuclease VII small subunit [Patescibacteria group bacterium]|nr:exodeoxyribonuclease VII small subunit [Patescibacteria group bacterium]